MWGRRIVGRQTGANTMAGNMRLMGSLNKEMDGMGWYEMVDIYRVVSG